jgi:hypothetical protein
LRLRHIPELSWWTLRCGDGGASRLHRWCQYALLDHHRCDGEIMPALLAWMPHHHDQHDQETDSGDVQRPENQGSDKDPSRADRPSIEEADQLQFHRPQTRARRPHGEGVPDQTEPANRDDRTDYSKCQAERTRRSRKQEDQRNADDGRDRHIDEIRHESLAERPDLHTRR